MRSTLFVASGGAAGAGVRWSVGEVLGTSDGRFPWATLVVNLAGCLLIGLAARRLERGSDAWFGLVTGVLGGLTTFSAFALETRNLLAGGHAALAAAYVGASVVAGVVAVEFARGPQVAT